MAATSSQIRPEDTLEKLAELGQVAKPQSNKTTHDPNYVKSLYGIESDSTSSSLSSIGGNTEKGASIGANHTPLDPEKMKAQQAEQAEAAKLAALRKRFKEWKGELDAHYDKSKQEEAKKKQQEQQMEEQKKQQEAQRKKEAESAQDEPQGKQKSKLGQPQRKASTSKIVEMFRNPETKAGGAK